LVKKDNAGWRRVVANAGDYSAFLRVLAIDSDRCWLLASRRGSGETVLLLAEGGDLTPYPEAGSPNLIASGGANGLVYTYSIKGAVIHVSGDAGVTWAGEKFVAPLPGAGELSVVTMEGVGARLFIVFKTLVSHMPIWGVVCRTGRPGFGEYKVSFYAPQGPHFASISDIAFRSEDEGLAGGSWATVFYIAPSWYQEEAAPYNHYLTAADPERGWWVIADASDGRRVLMWHP